MAKENETVADIIAEMRGARTEFPFVYLMGEPDTPEVIDFETKEIIAPRKINIRRVMVKELADRLEAAHKRERGDCAKLREAVCEILSYIESFHKYITPGKGKKLTALFAVADTIRNNARAALAAPPRNCDVGTPKEQDERFHRFCVEHRTGSCAGCHNPVGDYTCANGIRECALVWAQMPYEGGAK